MKFMATCSVARYAGMLGLVCALITPVFSARAQELDPFQTDTGSWKSFDRYKEEQKERLLSTMTGNPESDAKARAALQAEDEKKAEAEVLQRADEKTALIAPPALAAPVVAPPERPLALPVMPGINKGFDIRVGTTEKTEDEIKPTARIANIDSEPDLMLPKQDWLDAEQAAKLQAQGKDYLGDTTPLHIRLSFLPSFEAPAPKKSHGVAMAAAKPPAPVEPAKSPAEQAACAAIDAYKKRQLEAIQSDRETLVALQDAIAKLGLQKQLNFMTGADEKMNSSANNGPLIDMPSMSQIPALPPVAKP